MNTIRTLSTIGVAAGIAAFAYEDAHAAPITPTFASFGTLAAATFGGTGIPNDAVAITTFTHNDNTFTLGLTAHERFSNPPVGNDGAGTFTALTGANLGGSPPVLGTLWNFGLYLDIQDGGTPGDATVGNYIVELLYDLDAGAGTDEADHGVINFNGLGLGSLTTVQTSQNLLFSFLSTGIPGVTPPSTTFDPNAPGEYTFALRVREIGGSHLGQTAIQVNVIPEPGALAIFGLGLAGLGIARRRKRS